MMYITLQWQQKVIVPNVYGTVQFLCCLNIKTMCCVSINPNQMGKYINIATSQSKLCILVIVVLVNNHRPVCSIQISCKVVHICYISIYQMIIYMLPNRYQLSSYLQYLGCFNYIYLQIHVANQSNRIEYRYINEYIKITNIYLKDRIYVLSRLPYLLEK